MAKKKENYKIDADKTVENVLKMLDDRKTLEVQYFGILHKVTNNTEDLDILMENGNQFMMDMADQVRLLTLLGSMQTLANELVAKYGFEKAEEEEE